MSAFQDKSSMFQKAANESNGLTYYAAVGHSAYFCCFLLVEHIWHYSMSKDENDLTSLCKKKSAGIHETLINEIRSYIKEISITDSNLIYDWLTQLKILRVKADYKDEVFGADKANRSLSIMKSLIPLLSKY